MDALVRIGIKNKNSKLVVHLVEGANLSQPTRHHGVDISNLQSKNVQLDRIHWAILKF